MGKGRIGQREASAGVLAEHNLSQPTTELRSENLWSPSHNGSLDESHSGIAQPWARQLSVAEPNPEGATAGGLS